MTSMPASRNARAMIFAPRSCPSRPGFATTTRILRALSAVASIGAQLIGSDTVRRVRTPLAALVAALALAIPASASAAVTISSFKVTPSTTAAGAHPDLTIDTAFALDPTSDDVKSVGVLLPQGLVGDPNAADRCSASAFAADTCPASTKVGTTTADVTATILLVEAPQTVTGDVYNLTPQGGEAARLGVVLRPSFPGAQKVFLQSGVVVGPQTNYGLQTVFDGLPRDSGGIETRVNSMKLVLAGKAAHGTFIQNPTSCREAKSTATVTSYDQASSPKSATSSFTPTACDKLPFAPRVSGSVGGAGQTKRGVSPTLTTVVSTNVGDSTPSRVQVVLPPSIAANLGQVSRQCVAEIFAAGGCPPEARVGSASASSPLLPRPLTGPVIFTSNAATGEPALAVVLGPPVPLTLIGAVQLLPGALTNTFDGIPDLPLTRFELTLDGGGGRNTGQLVNLADICRADTNLALKGELLAHSGKTSSVTGQLEPAGCESITVDAGPGKPKGKLTLRFRKKRGTLTASFRSPTKLKRVRLALPKSMRKPSKRGLRVKGGKGRVRGRTLTITTKKKAVSLRWKGLKPGRSLAKRLKKHPRLVFVARVTDASGKTTKLRLGVRPSVR